MVKGDKYWIIENGFRVTSAEIISICVNLVLIETDKGKTLRLPKHRIYDTEENAMENLQKNKAEKNKKTPYDYMM